MLKVAVRHYGFVINYKFYHVYMYKYASITFHPINITLLNPEYI